MARIAFPISFDAWVSLFDNVKTRHDVLGAASPLHLFFNEDGIDIDENENLLAEAVQHHENFTALTKNKEKLSKEYRRIFKRVFANHRTMVQYLKKIYHKNVRKLGDWGVTVNRQRRVVYPVDFESRYQRVVALINKHNSFAAGTSPLESWLGANNLTMAHHQNQAAAAKTNFDDFAQASQLKEQHREARDRKMKIIRDHLNATGHYLMALSHRNPFKAGDWGYTIHAMTKPSKVRMVSIGKGMVKTYYDVVIGSEITVGVEGGLELHKGKAIRGEGVFLEPGSKYVIKRGYGVLTLKNSGTQPCTATVVIGNY